MDVDEMRARFGADGFLAVPDLLSPAELDALRDESVRICRRGGFDGWLGPHDGEPDDAVLRRYLCVHFPHKVSALAAEAMRHPAVVRIVTALVGPNVKGVQSMLFVRPAGMPGQAWHQDEHFVPTRDRSLVGAWLALDDATVETGCLRVVPGSHRRGILWPHAPHDDPDFDPVGRAVNHPYTEDDAVAVEVPAGGLVVFSGYLLHRSGPNRAATGFRRALANHYASAETLMPWMGAERDGPVGGADNRDVVLVAGEDPYAFKGTEDRAVPWARPPRMDG